MGVGVIVTQWSEQWTQPETWGFLEASLGASTPIDTDEHPTTGNMT